ncbi:hypothetical protein GCM10007242_39970 [Pigmentiphaga litoralis]|jgi:uncharacterized protein (TIGR01244 family)|uniref:TIGR01244 family sulfur transferase n=1 Tax=Pigmentiphaga litoralis TaxID=516702 RepID=UPI001674221A|nr:TIGR01244 family sulfur transferase [Pigmentiphaga litoralis]GGX29449.1 hypothetical protein GCM10007242_39970 [Pigmentiphaga litoralis]
MSAPSFTPLSDNFAVAPQLAPEDMAALAAAGFKSVINNRPDFEGGADQPAADTIGEAARAAGLNYVHQPVNGANLQAGDVATFAQQLETLPGPILAFCRSGARSTRLYQLALAQR